MEDQKTLNHRLFQELKIVMMIVPAFSAQNWIVQLDHIFHKANVARFVQVCMIYQTNVLNEKRIIASLEFI